MSNIRSDNAFISLFVSIGQVVWPSVSLAAFFGMLSGVIASIVESLGDYSACAAMCDVPSPPNHALNRGIAIEGFGGMLSCIWGTGTGTASYSSPIAILKITKVHTYVNLIHFP